MKHYFLVGLVLLFFVGCTTLSQPLLCPDDQYMTGWSYTDNETYLIQCSDLPEFNITGNFTGNFTEVDTLQSVTDRGSVTTNDITAGRLGVNRNISDNVGVFVRNDELTGNAGFSFSNQGGTEKTLAGLAYGRNTAGSISGYPRSELSRIWAVNSHLVLDTFVNDGNTYDVALAVKGVPSLVVDGDTGNVEITKDLSVQGNMQAETVGINQDSLAKLFVQQTDSGSSDIVMSSDVTLNSNGVGMLIEASGAKTGNNNVRPGIYMFNSRTDGLGLAFPLFRVYTAKSDNYIATNGGIFGAVAADGGANFRYMYIGTNDKVGFDNHLLRVGGEGLWINAPSTLPFGTVSDRALRVNGEASITGNVGIGNTNPSYKLDVTGNGRFTGTVRATDFITTSRVADFESTERSLDKLDNVAEWTRQDNTIDYAKHYSYVQNYEQQQTGTREVVVTYEDCEDEMSKCQTKTRTELEPIYENVLVKGLSMETRIAEMEKMIWELKKDNEHLQAQIDIIRSTSR